MTAAAAQPPMPETTEPADPSLPLCEVLEREYAAITGETVAATYDWRFTPEQILEPVRLADRLRDAEDRASWNLGRGELAELVQRLKKLGPDADPDVLGQVLADSLNQVLFRRELYDANTEDHFDGIRFRSQTMDRIVIGPEQPGDCVIRNRLILEDTFFELEKVYDRRLKAVYRKVHQRKLAALCLSGGGIRSATFALGVVQGLARYGILDHFHYLSTVSGGGYLGGWLSAWIRHASLSEVVQQLAAPTVRPLEPEPTPIWHLRTYSNYLSPRLGLLSADSWTLVATYLRNLILTWLVVVPPLIGAASAPIALTTMVAWGPTHGLWWQVQLGLTIGLLLLAAIWAVLAIRYVHRNRPVSAAPSERSALDDAKRDQRTFLRNCLWPLVGSAVIAVLCWAWISRQVVTWPRPFVFPLAFALCGTVIHWLGWRLGRAGMRLASGGVGEGAFIAVVGLMGGLGVSLLASYVPQLLETDLGSDLYAWLGVPALLLLVLLFSHIYIGYTSRTQVEAVREWSARFSAWLLIVSVAWLFGVGLILLGPEAFRLLVANRGERAVRIWQAVTGVIGVLSGVITLRAGGGAATPATQRPAGTPMNLPLMLAAPVFIVSLVVLMGWASRSLIGALETLAVRIPAVANLGWFAFILISLIVPGVLIWFGAWTAKRVDTNKFSLHGMYRSRLIRAYLGASRPAGERDPNPFTGFDNKDNVWLKDLWPLEAPFLEAERKLFHVVNVALNLVGGANLAWQQRKAESFTFSPLHCGAHNHGYRPTQRAKGDPVRRYYGGQDGASLGTAMTISGAAVSPNMGYHSSTVISFLLTLFNVRLGWWLGNPGHAGREVYDRSYPDSSLKLIIDEAEAHTDSKHPYVYLSDGGHFENLGLYEMVMRRCHTIVVSDGGCDPAGAFEDLGNAIRKIRVDFGIPIEFQEVKIYPRNDEADVAAGKYCAIGSIRYSCVDDNAADGILVYIKPAFYGSEPKDVFNYAQTSKTFPHETTADQFFSESQFESYRVLGSHVVDQILGSWSPGADPQLPPLARLVRRAADYVDRPAVA